MTLVFSLIADCRQVQRYKELKKIYNESAPSTHVRTSIQEYR
jgi:hypothetical protein